MAVINLHERYESQILRGFNEESYIGNHASKKYNFKGVKTIEVSTPQRMTVNNYQRSGMSRFGTPEEIGDTIQTMTMREDRSFTGTIDEGNATDQQRIKKAGEIMKEQTQNVTSPEIDMHCFKEWAKNAGVVASVTTPSKSNIVSLIVAARTAMKNSRVPIENRRLYVGSTVYGLLLQTSEFLNLEKLGTDALSKGVVGKIFKMEVVELPDDMLPTGVNFMIVHKDSVIKPVKLKTTRIHVNPPGLDGHLLEGRYYFDAFVLGERADGVYVGADASVVIAAPTISITSNKATVTSAGNVIYYTLDGSDPRYSKTAKIYAAAVDMTAGQTIKACAKNDAKLNSTVAESTND